MSLKAFHIVFVTVSVLLMLVLAGWCFGNYRDEPATGSLLGGLASLAAAAALVAYGKIFLRKFKHISYL